MSRNIIFLILAVVLVFPVAAYVYQFGLGFWKESSEWASLGGYIGGIYAPILTLLTLSVLCVQIYLQVIQHRQNLVSIQEAQLTEYLNELNFELDKNVGEGITLRTYFINILNTKNIDAIDEMDLSEVFELNQNYHKLFSMWCGAMACLKYIKTCSNLKSLESTHYAIQKNKVIAYMGPQICSSLDKYNYAMLLAVKELTGQSSSDNIEYEFWLDRSQP